MSIKNVLKHQIENRWNIGFIEDGISSVLSGQECRIKWVKNSCQYRWFADPFILFANAEHVEVLVEEFSYERRIGRIAKLVISRPDYKLLSYMIILEQDTHLSFPFIFRYQGHIYVLPENSQSGKSTLYEYFPESESLKRINVIADEPLTDATILEYDGAYYVLSTQLPNPNGNILTVRHLDTEKMRCGDKVCEIMFENNAARNAGEVLFYNNRLVRPMQDCSKCYGGGVILRAFNPLSRSQQDMNVLASLYPDSYRYNQGLHTFNTLDDLIVVDGRGFFSPFWGRIINRVFKISRK